jgi:hypothetical protein
MCNSMHIMSKRDLLAAVLPHRQKELPERLTGDRPRPMTLITPVTFPGGCDLLGSFVRKNDSKTPLFPESSSCGFGTF